MGNRLEAQKIFLLDKGKIVLFKWEGAEVEIKLKIDKNDKKNL